MGKVQRWETFPKGKTPIGGYPSCGRLPWESPQVLTTLTKALPITKNMFLVKSFRLKVGIVLGTFIRIEIVFGILT
jgi:hypothetical protein